MPKALYTDYPWPDAELERSTLAAAGCELVVASVEDEDTLAQLAADVDCIITCWASVTAKVIDAAKQCRHIARTGIGLDNIDVARATERGMVVTNVPDYCAPEVVEHTLALLFCLARKIHIYHHLSQAGDYNRQAGLPIERMEDQTVGVIGTGQIGSIVVRRLAAMGMRVLVNNLSRRVPADCTWTPFDALLADSDYVLLLCPLTAETKNLSGRAELARMKSTAFLVNTSRGGLVDHAALAEALASNAIAGAGLDVQVPEPPDLSKPPYNDPRVIVTPHAAFMSTRATNELRTRVAGQVIDVIEGREPENIVNRG